MKMRKIVVNLSQREFEYLELLAVALVKERVENDEDFIEEITAGMSKKNNDFGPLVSRLAERILGSVAVGVERPGSWERGTVDALTGWQGLVLPNMAGQTIREDAFFDECSVR